MNQTAQRLQTLKDRPALIYSGVLVLGCVLLLLSWLLFIFGMIEYVVQDFKQDINHAAIELHQSTNRATGRSAVSTLDAIPLSLILYAISSLSFFLMGGFCAVWGIKGFLRLRKMQIKALMAAQALKKDSGT